MIRHPPENEEDMQEKYISGWYMDFSAGCVHDGLPMCVARGQAVAMSEGMAKKYNRVVSANHLVPIINTKCKNIFTQGTSPSAAVQAWNVDGYGTSVPDVTEQFVYHLTLKAYTTDDFQTAIATVEKMNVDFGGCSCMVVIDAPSDSPLPFHAVSPQTARDNTMHAMDHRGGGTPVTITEQNFVELVAYDVCATQDGKDLQVSNPGYTCALSWAHKHCQNVGSTAQEKFSGDAYTISCDGDDDHDWDGQSSSDEESLQHSHACVEQAMSVPEFAEKISKTLEGVKQDTGAASQLIASMRCNQMLIDELPGMIQDHERKLRNFGAPEERIANLHKIGNGLTHFCEQVLEVYPDNSGLLTHMDMALSSFSKLKQESVKPCPSTDRLRKLSETTVRELEKAQITRSLASKLDSLNKKSSNLARCCQRESTALDALMKLREQHENDVAASLAARAEELATAEKAAKKDVAASLVAVSKAKAEAKRARAMQRAQQAESRALLSDVQDGLLFLGCVAVLTSGLLGGAYSLSGAAAVATKALLAGGAIVAAAGVGAGVIVASDLAHMVSAESLCRGAQKKLVSAEHHRRQSQDQANEARRRQEAAGRELELASQRHQQMRAEAAATQQSLGAVKELTTMYSGLSSDLQQVSCVALYLRGFLSFFGDQSEIHINGLDDLDSDPQDIMQHIAERLTENQLTTWTDKIREMTKQNECLFTATYQAHQRFMMKAGH